MQSTVNQENPYMRIALLRRLVAQRSANIFESRRSAASIFYAAQGPSVRERERVSFIEMNENQQLDRSITH